MLQLLCLTKQNRKINMFLDETIIVKNFVKIPEINFHNGTIVVSFDVALFLMKGRNRDLNLGVL